MVTMMLSPGDLMEVYDQILQENRHCILLGYSEKGDAEVLYKGRRYKTFRRDGDIPGIPIIDYRRQWEKSMLRAGYVYNPYIPLQITPSFKNGTK